MSVRVAWMFSLRSSIVSWLHTSPEDKNNWGTRCPEISVAIGNFPLRPIHSFWRTSSSQFLTSLGSEVVLHSPESVINVLIVAFHRSKVSANHLTADHNSAFAPSPRSAGHSCMSIAYKRITLVMNNNNRMRIAPRPVHLISSVSLSTQMESLPRAEHEFYHLFYLHVILIQNELCTGETRDNALFCAQMSLEMCQ
jgi:hypothetical protein